MDLLAGDGYLTISPSTTFSLRLCSHHTVPHASISSRYMLLLFAPTLFSPHLPSDDPIIRGEARVTTCVCGSLRLHVVAAALVCCPRLLPPIQQGCTPSPSHLLMRQGGEVFAFAQASPLPNSMSNVLVALAQSYRMGHCWWRGGGQRLL